LGLNEKSDAGMMQITEPGDYPFVAIAANDSLTTGQWCLAAGFPGRRPTDGRPTLRLGRVLFASHSIVGTDCALIGGDSGGPLFNLAGEVVAIHSRIGARLTTNLHVPVALFRESWQQLIDGEVIGDLGPVADPPNSDLRPMIGVTGNPDQTPCTIASVFVNSPAERAGIRAGDVIEKLAGRPVAQFRHLAWILHDMVPGQTVTFLVKRGEESLEFDVVLGSATGPIPGGAPPKDRKMKSQTSENEES
jgi:serine protease Do